MSRRFFYLILLTMFAFHIHAQEKEADTVVVPLAESSRIIFTVGDRDDLEILRHYDYQQLFEDIIQKLQAREETQSDSGDYTAKHAEGRALPDNAGDRDAEAEKDENWEADENTDYGDDSKWEKSRRGRIGQTWQSYNIDLGTNNYLAGDQFPDGSEPYAVRPWGSWYVAGNSVQRTRLGKNVFVEWGLGVSWYNFKFQEDNILIEKDEFGVDFAGDARNVAYIKSKLSATFINASLVPVLDFSDRTRKPRVWDGHHDGFRFGVGPYVGYRIASKSKLVYEADGEREREKVRDSYYLNNLRYGLRMQLGVRSTDLFLNYDMNDLFAEGKGPKLSAISFGLIF